MPQMAPLSWVMMNSMFTLLLIISLLKTYFMVKNETNAIPSMNKPLSALNLNWKW